MLEFLSSKVVMMMAMVVMVSVISSMFTIERDAIRAGDLQHAADDIAAAVESMTTRAAEGRSTIVFAEADVSDDVPGRAVPMAVAGSTYTVTISQSQVVASQKGVLRASDFRGRVHTFDPSLLGKEHVTNQSNLKGLDEANGPLTITSGNDIRLENILFKVDGDGVMLTFATIAGR